MALRHALPKPEACWGAHRAAAPRAKWNLAAHHLWRRQYCEDEPDWAAAVELLSQDDGAGWALLHDLATGGRSAAELAAGRFCEL